MTRPHRVGLIGVGPISDWHVRAVRCVGMEVTGVSTRPGSTRLADFAGRHRIATVFGDWREMIEHSDDFDAWIVATRPDGTPQILDALIPRGRPILVEKPVSWSSRRLARMEASGRQVLVGYNRRFYRPVLEARAEARGGTPLLAQLCLPEGIVEPDGDDPDSLYLRPFFENSCHGIDMVRFLLGPVSVENVRLLRTGRGHIAGVAASLSTERGDLVSFLGNWGSPANYSLTLHRPGRRLELLPWEVATVYEGMDMIDPSDEWPIRRYLPRQTRRVLLDEIDRKEKPGFVAQAQALRDLVEGKPAPENAATLADARAAVALCESLVDVRYES